MSKFLAELLQKKTKWCNFLGHVYNVHEKVFDFQGDIKSELNYASFSCCMSTMSFQLWLKH